MRRAFAVFLIALAGVTVGAQSRQHVRLVAPVERGGFSHLTSYDSLQVFLGSLARRGGMRLETIAVTEQGRRVTACLISRHAPFGSDHQKLRLMLFAQQHGNEPAGKEALTMLLAKCASGELDRQLKRCDLIVVPQMNPDGAELRQRRTADSVDLNRNHLLLTSPQTRGLHDLFEQWLPQVTLDVHEFDPFSRSWEEAGIIKTVDVQFGLLTNLNSPATIRTYEEQRLFPSLSAAVNRLGYRFHEYLVGTPQEGIRFSTTEINDGRQSFGILGTLSFIQEGRGGKDLEDNLSRRAHSQLASIEALLSYCADHSGEITSLVRDARRRLSTPGPGERCVLFMGRHRGGKTMTIPVVTVPGGRDTVWTVRPLLDSVGAEVVTTVPHGYVISRDLASVRSLLDRHHVAYSVLTKEEKREVTRFNIDSLRTETWEEEAHERPSMRVDHALMTCRPGDIIVPTAQLRSMVIVTLLEPDSMWGLVKYPQFRSLLGRGLYPIARY